MSTPARGLERRAERSEWRPPVQEASVVERPMLFTLGILLTAIRCIGITAFASLLHFTDSGLGLLLMFHPEPDRLLPFGSAELGAEGWVLLAVIGYYGCIVAACLGAWRSRHRSTVALLLLSGLGLLHSGPLGLTIQAITLFGCAQALSEGAPAPRRPGL